MYVRKALGKGSVYQKPADQCWINNGKSWEVISEKKSQDQMMHFGQLVRYIIYPSM